MELTSRKALWSACIALCLLLCCPHTSTDGLGYSKAVTVHDASDHFVCPLTLSAQV